MTDRSNCAELQKTADAWKANCQIDAEIEKETKA